MKRKSIKAMAVGAAVAASLVSAPAVANAGLCAGGYIYDITSSSDMYWGIGTTYKDGPGGSMTVSVTTNKTISSSATVTAGATLGGIIAQAKFEVSGTITSSNSVEVGHAYTHGIAAGRYGNMQYAVWGKKVNWQYILESANCARTVKSSGIANLTTSTEGWRYWETAS
jgi:hypothetical protein